MGSVSSRQSGRFCRGRCTSVRQCLPGFWTTFRDDVPAVPSSPIEVLSDRGSRFFSYWARGRRPGYRGRVASQPENRRRSPAHIRSKLKLRLGGVGSICRPMGGIPKERPRGDGSSPSIQSSREYRSVSASFGVQPERTAMRCEPPRVANETLHLVRIEGRFWIKDPWSRPAR